MAGQRRATSAALRLPQTRKFEAKRHHAFACRDHAAVHGALMAARLPVSEPSSHMPVMVPELQSLNISITRGADMKRILITAAVLTFTLAGAAQAQTTGTATTDLNLRSGPGPEQPVIGLIKARHKAQIVGCVEGSLWCQVEYRGKQGWAYSQYMSLSAGGGRVVVVREPANVAGVPVVTYDGYVEPTYRADVAPVAAAITAPAFVGTGGTGAAAIGAPKPTIYASTYAPPPPAVNTYVTSNPAPSFPYVGEVVVGARLPQTVVLNNVPDYRYQYVYVNDTAVLVDPITRQIVYVFR
jgi:uncharacterized protein YraI